MKLTIVMYHYVRQLKHSLFPDIKGLETELFKEQIAYIKKHYSVISAYDLIDIIESGSCLPPNALLLTFDDGYIDHFTDVFPILKKEKLPGCFFPPSKPIFENKVLDVHKIHFIMAATPQKNLLVEYVFGTLDEYRDAFNLESNDFYWNKCGVPNRFDSAETIFVKRILQRDLPKELRGIIADKLFEKFVSVDGEAFSKELYMNLDQVSYLQANGMYIGSHGYEHCWLDSINEDAQRREIDLSLQFLDRVGSDTSRWIMCYPCGGYNESLLNILKEKNCTVGLTTRVDIADLSNDNSLTLPRIDTNDLPMNSEAKTNIWTQKGTVAVNIRKAL